MGHAVGGGEVEAILAQVTDLLDAYDISTAERLLAGLLADDGALAAATPEQRCRVSVWPTPSASLVRFWRQSVITPAMAIG